MSLIRFPQFVFLVSLSSDLSLNLASIVVDVEHSSPNHLHIIYDNVY
jgi:hypothetical protein